MKITVITPVFNGETTIKTCIESVLNQTYRSMEYIIVDGSSKDNTVAIIKEYHDERLTWVSEKDSGLYDAINKGIKMSSGDVICFLCADDMYANNTVLEKIGNVFDNNPDKDMIYSDIVYVNRNDLTKIDRYWKSCTFEAGLFKKGWLPPNTALFIKKRIFLEHGMFSLDYKFASDFELQYRFFEKLKIKSLYSPGILVKMRSGGVSNSSLRNMYRSLRECYLALKSHKVKYPLPYIINTVFYRLRQVFIPSAIKKLYKSEKEHTT
jgi:glycosyltransferase